MLKIYKNFRVVDEDFDGEAAVVVETGAGIGSGRGRWVIRDLIPPGGRLPDGAAVVVDGAAWGREGLVLTPAFVDLHAHFRDPGFPQKETLESGCLAAAAGGYGTVVCMANTSPPLDTPALAAGLRARAAALGLVDLYPAMTLTRGMEGRELPDLPPAPPGAPPLVLSEDGKDVEDDALFLAALERARRRGALVSCHCDKDGENNATRRALALGRQAGCRLHIAHVSTAEAVAAVRAAKAAGDFPLTCEATPHHLALTEANGGRVNPPLRTEADRLAVIAGLREGVIDVIATDHAPHTPEDKARGAPGFSGLETAFAVCYTTLVQGGVMDLKRLSSLMAAAPARVLGLTDRGRVLPGLQGNFAILDTQAVWRVEPDRLKSRGKNTPFAGRELQGRVLA